MNKSESGGVDNIKEYLSFAESHPTLFVNPPEGGYFILLDKNEIRRVEADMAKKLEQSGHPPRWAQIGIIYEDQYLLILRDAVRFPDGSFGTYIRTVEKEDSAPGVVILPIYNQKVLLVRHFRHATRNWHLEIPRGFGTKGLSSEENAHRELSEETGSVASRLIPLGMIHSNTGLGSESVHLFFAEVSSISQPESHEAISELIPVDLSEFERLISQGEITDSFTIVAYTRARLHNLL
ncbi:MAG: NUDIX hydrolase [Thermoplasmata archaeon]|nr:MAG: NUDIX hydrolase [Thermoplasmata archaeon]